MTISKDGPGGSTAGPQGQETAAKTDQSGVPFSEQADSPVAGGRGAGPLHAAVSSPNVTMPPLSAGTRLSSHAAAAEEIEDPMARLAEIIAQPSAVPPVQSPGSSAMPVMPVGSATSHSQSPQAAMPLPLPVALPQIEVTAEDRALMPAAAPARKRFSLFRRKTVQKEAPTVAELAASQTQKGFFARRAARRAAIQHYKRTSRDKRHSRRIRRLWFEELLGWIFVPVILVALYYASLACLKLLGTSPDAVIQGLKALRGHL